MKPTYVAIRAAKHEYRKKTIYRVDVYKLCTREDDYSFLSHIWFFTYNIAINRGLQTETMRYLEHNQFIKDSERPEDFDGYYYHQDPRCYIQITNAHHG